MADVGANVGLWSQSMLAAAAKADRSADLRLHAFEPDPAAFDRLTQTLNGAPADLNRTALSDRAGSAVLHMVGPAAGTNSLYPVVRHEPGRGRTGDHESPWTSMPSTSGIARFALVKIDAEGHDLGRPARRARPAREASHRGGPVRVQPPLDTRPVLPP